MTFKLVIIMSIITLSNNGFTLIRGLSERNTLNVIDLGLFLTLIVLAYLLVTEKVRILKNPISTLIIIYLIVVFVKVPIASLLYGQSIIDGFIAIRQNFYFSSFFVFLLLLKDIKSINKTLTTLLLITFVIGILSFINYFYPVIFVDLWEHDLQRAGVKRGYVPGMWLMSFCLIWCSIKWVYVRKEDKTSGLLLLFYYVVHFFRQTRSLILSCTGVFLYILFIKRKFFLLVSTGIFSLIMIFAVDMYMEENIILDSFGSSVEEVSSSSGTWGSRVLQAELAWEIFKDSPIFGSPGVAIRMQHDEARTSKERELALIAYKADLGYLSWLKYYGLFGVIWLILFFHYIWVSSKKTLKYYTKGSEQEMLPLFSLSYLYFVVFSFITIPHFLYPSGIVLLSLMAAITVRINNVVRIDLVMKKQEK